MDLKNKKVFKYLIIGCIGFVFIMTLTYTNGVFARYDETSKVFKDNNISTSTVKPHTYTGYQIKPSPTVKYNGTTLTKDKDYTLTYENNINVSTNIYGTHQAEIIITGKGKYSGSVTKYFTIKPFDISDYKSVLSRSSISLSTNVYTYDGTYKKPDVKIEIGNKNNLKSTTWFWVSSNNYETNYYNNLNYGTATVTIKGKNNLSGSAVLNYKIEKANLNSLSITLPKYSYEYTSNEIQPTVTIKHKNGRSLTRCKDYYLKYENNKNAGNATINITGMGNYIGSITKRFVITKRDISGGSIELDKELYDWTGKQIKPTIVNVRTAKGVRIADYSVDYGNNINDDGWIRVTGKGNNTGTITKHFKIGKNPNNINLATITIDSNKYAHEGDVYDYTGDLIKPSVTVKIGNTTLKSSDYTVSYSNNKEVGNATITIEGKGKYYNKVTKYFEIKYNLNKTIISTDRREIEYGMARPTVNSVKTQNNKELVEGVHYKVNYIGNYEIGTQYIKITAIGENTKGSKTISYNIIRYNIKKAFVDIDFKGIITDSDDSKRGICSRGNIEIYLSAIGDDLIENRDYEIKFLKIEYELDTESRNWWFIDSKISYIICGINNYSGEKSDEMIFKTIIAKYDYNICQTVLIHEYKKDLEIIDFYNKALNNELDKYKVDLAIGLGRKYELSKDQRYLYLSEGNNKLKLVRDFDYVCNGQNGVYTVEGIGAFKGKRTFDLR